MAELLPCGGRGTARFPAIGDVESLFAAAGFSLVVVVEAAEPAALVPTVIEWLVNMRHADTLLTALSDEEFGEGLAALGKTDQPSVEVGCAAPGSLISPSASREFR